MQKCMKEDSPNPTLKSVVALLKLGDWDPDVFYKFRDVILNQVRGSRVRGGLSSPRLRRMGLCQPESPPLS